MKSLIILLFAILPVTDELNWFTDINKARQEAVKSHKAILLYFTGSDWCSPCMRLKKEYLSHPAFQKLAAEKLVLVYADFPRKKANKLDRSQEEMNAELAEKYNSKGAFPLLVLMDEKGNVIKEWSGLPRSSAADFVNELSSTEQRCHASN